jgi:hypothetical protein
MNMKIPWYEILRELDVGWLLAIYIILDILHTHRNSSGHDLRYYEKG